MLTNDERLISIIEKIRKRDDWKPSHETITVDDEEINYYDTGEKDSYFSIRYEDIKIQHLNTGGIQIEYEDWEAYDNFVINDWLVQLEKLFEKNIMILNGKKYQLVEDD